MTGFTVRDARLAQIERAYDRTADAGIEAELDALKARWQIQDWTTADDIVEPAALEYLWQGFDIGRGASDDPVRRATRSNPVVTAAQSAAIAAISRPYYRPLDSFRDDVLAALGGSKIKLARLAVVVHEAWLALDPPDRPYPFEDVGALLPLGIETVFEAPTRARSDWLMKLRVIPQPPSIDYHRPAIEDGEREAADAFWRTVGGSSRLTSARVKTPRVTAAFTTLATAVGPARATWLAAETRPVKRDGVIHADPINPAPADAADARVWGLPPRLSVSIWVYDGDQEALKPIGHLPDESAGEGATISPDIPLALPRSAADAEDSWLVDWTKARAAGLGGEFLPDGLGPDDLGGVCVAGLGDLPAREIFRRHVLSGRLARISLGAATNSVAGADTATTTDSRKGTKPVDGAPTLSDWQDALERRVLQRKADPDQPLTMSDMTISRLIAGTSEILPSLAVPAGLERRDQEEADADDLIPSTGLSRLMVRALWPALWGSWLIDGWPTGAHGPELAAWSVNWVSPEGPLPPLRFGTQPYGVLPVTDLRDWQPAPDWRGESAATAKLLNLSLRAALRTLHAELRPGGTAVGADEDTYAQLLGRGAASRVFRWRHFVDDDLWRTLNPGHPTDVFLDDLAESFGLLELAYDPAWGAPIDVGTSAANLLPLVQPRRSAYFRRAGDQRDQLLRVPLAYLVDLILGRRQYLHEPSPSNPTSFAQVFTGSNTLQFSEAEWSGEGLIGLLPDSLLARLLGQAALAANEWRAKLAIGDRDTFLGHIWRPDFWNIPAGYDPERDYDRALDDTQMRAAMTLARLVDPHRVEWVDGYPRVGAIQYPDVPVSTDAEVEGRKDRLERAFGAVLDTAATRIDPWVTSFAWERLANSSYASSRRQRLGAYGWVYGPFIGQPGPTPSGLIHTPSLDQTTLATILLDNHLEADRRGVRNDDGELLWQMNITSDAMRIADAIAEDVRQGLHFYDVLGRAVEDVIGADPHPAASPSAYQRISSLRVDYRMYPDVADPRQVCHGLDALAGLIDKDDKAIDPRYPLSETQLRRLGLLRRAVDVLADLTLVDGAAQSLSRSVERASAAMDAASGLGVMPSLDYPKTKPSGFMTETTVLSVLPLRAAGGDAAAGSLAEPSVAAFLAERFGVEWKWTATLEDGSTPSITLDKLGLDPIDTLAWSPAQLLSLARSAMGLRDVVIEEVPNRTWLASAPGQADVKVTLAQLGVQPSELAELTAPQTQRLVVTHAFGTPAPAKAGVVVIESEGDSPAWSVRDALGNPLGVFDSASLGGGALPQGAELRTRLRALAGHPATIDVEQSDQLGVAEPTEVEQCARLAAMLGVPATQQHLAKTKEVVDVTGPFEELRARYAAAHADLTDAHAQASKAGQLGVDGAPAQRAAIARAARWGFTPDASPQDAATFHVALLGGDAPAGATSLRDLARQAAAVLRARLDAAPRPSGKGGLRPAKEMAAPLDDHAELRAQGVPDGVQALATALSALVSPQGRLPVLAAWSTDDLTARTRLESTPRPGIDAAWLTVVAAVRPPLARLEAVQLGPDPLTTWSSSADPWLEEDVIENIRRRGTADEIKTLAVPRLVIAYGADGAMAGDHVVAGVMDAFTEAVPMEQRDTHAAFGFNAPAARAPQAILLAVPPRPRTRLEDDVLQRILSQTRALMIARTATVRSLGRLDRVMRSTIVPYTADFLADPAYPR